MAFLENNVMIERINVLKKERGAVILAHNYELAEVQDIADYTGDSLELSIRAAETQAKVILFCGVSFMAETAKVLSPDKTVLIPAPHAGCAMADMVDAAGLSALKAQHPGAMVVTYVNSTAEVKALSDICVTSANAEKIVSRIPADKEIIFVPDMNLGRNIMKKTGRKMIFWQGFCPTHRRITNAEIERRKKEFPNALVLAHPECNPEIAPLVDEFLSTGGIIILSFPATAVAMACSTFLTSHTNHSPSGLRMWSLRRMRCIRWSSKEVPSRRMAGRFRTIRYCMLPVKFCSFTRVSTSRVV